MNFQDYMNSVAKRCKELPLPQHRTHMGLGVVGEMGELADAIKKTTIYGKTMDVVHFKEEVGDVAWYIVGYAWKLGVPFKALEQAFMRGLTEAANDPDYAVMTDGEFILIMTLGASGSVLGLQTQDENENVFLEDAGCVTQLAEILGALCQRWAFDIGEVFDMNNAKLEKRYGQRYSGEAALNRDVAAERKVLEGQAQDTSAAGAFGPPSAQDTKTTVVSGFTVEGRAEFVGYPPAGPLTSAPDQVWDVTKGKFVHRSELGKE